MDNSVMYVDLIYLNYIDIQNIQEYNWGGTMDVNEQSLGIVL